MVNKISYFTKRDLVVWLHERSFSNKLAHISLKMLVLLIEIERILVVPFDSVSTFGISPHGSGVYFTNQMSILPSYYIVASSSDWGYLEMT